jgi:hypothetical protein
VIIKGDPAVTISDIENAEIMFKDGVGFDSKKLINPANGRHGQYWQSGPVPGLQLADGVYEALRPFQMV